MRLLKCLLVFLIVNNYAMAAVPLTEKASDQSISPPSSDKAQIIFLNPSNSIAGAFPTGIYEVKDNERVFMVMLGSKMKFVADVEPGKHLFMSQMGAVAHFMDADVEAGKRYYVLLRFIYAHGFQLRPIRNSGQPEYNINTPKVSSWLKDCVLVKKAADSEVWYEKHKDITDKAQATYMKEWLEKDAEQRSQLTLNKDDSIDK